MGTVFPPTGKTLGFPNVISNNHVDLLRDYITIREVAAELDVSYYTAYALAARGRLGTPLIVGRTHLYPRATAMHAIEQRRVESSARVRGRAT